MTKNRRDAKIQREVGTDGEPERQKEAETQIDEAGETDRNAKKEKRRKRETETRGLRCRDSETEQCRAPMGRRAQAKTTNIQEGGRDAQSEMWDPKIMIHGFPERRLKGVMGAGRGEAWAARVVGPEERWAGARSAWPHAHSIQGEDEGAVSAVAHLLLLLLTAAPQHRLPVWG